MRRIFVFFLLFWLAAASARAEVRLETPERAGLGQPFVARIVADAPFTNPELRWLEREVKPTVKAQAGLLVAEILLGTDVLEDRPGIREVTATVQQGGRVLTLRGRVEIEPRAYPTQELTLPPKMVTPPQSEQARIARDQEETRRVKDLASLRQFWTLPLARPVPGSIESVYGAARVLNGQPRNPHRGLDFEAQAGDPVRACATGTVVLVADQYYAGKCVFVDHGNGVASMYFHLSEALVRPGYRVDRGEVLGRVGSTGRATGPHLHFALSAQGRLIDPQPLLEE
jgi:murein DD-endopeptidase MepM/ murein hydrolase activator NlpD